MNTKISKKLTRASIPVLAFLASMENAYCQITADSALSSVQSQLSNLGSSIVSIVQIVMGLVAIVFIAINLVKYLKAPNHETNNDLLKVGIGLIIAIILIQVVRTLFGF